MIKPNTFLIAILFFAIAASALIVDKVFGAELPRINSWLSSNQSVTPMTVVFQDDYFAYSVGEATSMASFYLDGKNIQAVDFILRGEGVLPSEVIAWDFLGTISVTFLAENIVTGDRIYKVSVAEDSLNDLQEVRVFKNGSLAKTISQSSAVNVDNMWSVSGLVTIPFSNSDRYSVEWDTSHGTQSSSL